MYFMKESCTVAVENSLAEPGVKLTESAAAEMNLPKIRAVYPLIRAITAEVITQNYTFYTPEALKGNKKGDPTTGYASFVKPYGKPIIREHRLQDEGGMFGGSQLAEIPMGRILWAGYRKNEGVLTPAPGKKPGFVEGTGNMAMVGGVTDPYAIQRLMGGIYHTVSIGYNAEKVVESISGQDIASLHKKGEDLPPYERGQWYDGKLSYWMPHGLCGKELSYVNNPSDVLASTEDSDIGEAGLRLLLGEKVPGKSSKEFNFFDAKTYDKVNVFTLEESAYDNTFDLVDSAEIATDLVWLNNIRGKTLAENTESASVIVKESYTPEEAIAALEEMKEAKIFTEENMALYNLLVANCSKIASEATEVPVDTDAAILAAIDEALKKDEE